MPINRILFFAEVEGGVPGGMAVFRKSMGLPIFVMSHSINQAVLFL
jgi:hypothetical protein